MGIGLSDTKERIESIFYKPGLQGSGDLESGTNNITATSEASGTGDADYSKSLTLPKPSDARIKVLQIAARLAVTIDSFGEGASELNCRVYVDQQDTDHRLFDLTGDNKWTTTGNKLEVILTKSSDKPTIFNLLKDGSSHTFYFFFWVDAGNAVISVVELWEGVGAAPGNNGTICLEICHTGWLTFSSYLARVGSGNISQRLYNGAYTDSSCYGRMVIDLSSGIAKGADCTALCGNKLSLAIYSSVSTDLVYINSILIVLRSEQ